MVRSKTLVTAENVSAIASNAPQALQENKTSHDRCLDFGQKLLDRVKKEGMSDDLDKEIALFIERAKKTVKKMNDSRSPITKLFDEVRNVFTTMENEVNVSKSGTVPFSYRKSVTDMRPKRRQKRRKGEQQKSAANWLNRQRRSIVLTCWRTIKDSSTYSLITPSTL